MINKRVDPDYELWRENVMRRDKYTCQMPNCGSQRKPLVVHHIIPYAKSVALRTDPNNGITLCRKCHKDTFGKESRYAHIFLAVINGENNGTKTSKN